MSTISSNIVRPDENRDHILTWLTVTSAVALFCSVICIIVFFTLLACNSRRVNIPLVKITMSIQSVNAVALIITLILNEVHITSEILCSTLRYVLYICYLSSIFMICAVTIHLWLVITRRKLNQAKRNERWYYIIPFSLAFALSAALAAIPNSAYGIPNRCLVAIVPSRNYLIIRWCLYYAWFVVASAISLVCMISVLRSARRLSHTTTMHGRRYPASTEAYRNAVNARANSKRLRSLVFYTIAYPLISLVCNLPQLLQELLSTTMHRPLKWVNFASRILLYSEGFMLSLAFFSYPAVLHSIRDVTHSAIQYWVVEQEEFWRMRHSETRHGKGARVLKEELSDMLLDKEDVKNFTSRRGRLYHFILSRTPEGKLVSGL
ncbi:hypothetical protein GGI21_001927 [Coemansia aciculifera]|uniref:Uncharacterized protein n=1 Tax=Coemansia aciculifera TaxID=417176 RepID=A0ACC1M4Y2_9FUNG|nr:hypothetical protein IWW38_002302 [Coemansia aciculifera]KAJ2909393.1 hypothetical protein GGI21_001927 [Coemansia aciculifera]